MGKRYNERKEGMRLREKCTSVSSNQDDLFLPTALPTPQKDVLPWILPQPRDLLPQLRVLLPRLPLLLP